MFKLIDTHCHLTHKKLIKNCRNVLHRAGEAGVAAVVCASANVEESIASQAFSRRYEGVHFTAGLHPHEAKSADSSYLADLERLAGDVLCVAIGECGLDYHYDFSPRDCQRQVFAEQLDLARRLGRKIVIHTRQALADTLAIIRSSLVDGHNIVFHSFTEGPEQARKVLDLGAMINFSGIATFAGAASIRQTAAIVPDDRILIETDAPYLSPEPVRKMKVNEPANVVHVAACLAAVRKTSLENFASITTRNSNVFFSLRVTSTLGSTRPEAG